MRRPLLRTLSLLTIVLLAGCGAFGQVDVGESTTPSTPTPSGTELPLGVLPPGVSVDGIVDAYRLANAHSGFLAGRSYTVTESRIVRATNGTVVSQTNGTVAVEDPTSRYLFVESVRGPKTPFFGGRNGTIARYANGTVVAQKVTTASGETTHRIMIGGRQGDPVAPADVYHGSPRHNQRIGQLLQRGRNVTVRQIDSSTYRLRTSNFTGSSLPVAGITVSNLAETSFTAVVTSNGFVQEYQFTFRGTADGRSVTGAERVRYSKVDETTVEQPSWFSMAVGNETIVTV